MHADGDDNWQTTVYPNKRGHVEVVSARARPGTPKADRMGERVRIATIALKARIPARTLSPS
eukprot:438610-Pyramimonas_sp.AAC.1